VNGQKYGPVSDDVLREWAASGRLKPTDHVWTEGMSDWAPASTVGGLFGAATPMPVAATFSYARPHRGGTVLTLGILGIVCCLICAIIAWVMGASDLKEMAAGRMDRSGEGITRAGMVCGIIGVVLSILWFIVGMISGIAENM
jgi:hypothetical protein